MPNPFYEGNLAWIWYEFWLVLAAAGASLAIGIYIWATTDGGLRGATMRALAALFFVATWPLSLERMGFGVSGQEETMAAFNLLGSIAYALLGIFHFLFRRRGRRGAAVYEPGGAMAGMTPATGRDDNGSDGNGLGAPTAWLHFRSGEGAGQTVPLGPGVTTIGRAAENDIVVDDPAVSRRHARIEHRAGRFFLTDAGSSSGTMVGRESAAEDTPLEPGSVINLGKTELVFMQEGGPVSGASSTRMARGAYASGAGASQTRVASAPSMTGGETVLAGPPPEPVMAWLAVTEGPSKGATAQLARGEVRIGRDEGGNDLVVRDSAVSRRHASLIVKGEDELLLVDAGSTGGAKVNGRPLGRALKNNDTIQVGNTTLELVSVDEARGDEQASATAATVLDGGARAGGVLIVRKGPDAGSTLKLDPEGPNLIGRDREAQVRLSDNSVSHRHAGISVRGDRLVLCDMGSRNGTRVNGERTEPVSLKGGDMIEIGCSRITVMTPGKS